jgi:hypothetical protein
MKLLYLMASASVVLGLAPLACSSSNDDIMMGSDGGSSSAGTKAQGGVSTGTAGDKPYGGSSSSGGSASSGGFTSSAGNGSGGSSSTSGDGSGGSLTVGGDGSGGSTGGTSSGGSAGAPSSTCDQDTDCEACYYPKAPASTQECYCVDNCSPPPMSKSDCAANQAEFEKVCANVVLPCPAIKCVPPPPVGCSNHMCVTK